METTTHFGFHDAGGVWFLHQDDGAANALGLSLDSPFVVRPQRRTRAPHAIRLSDTDIRGLPHHPLITRMLPIPQPGLTVVNGTGETVRRVIQAARLCSPTAPLVAPLWTQTLRTWANLMMLTNAAPLVLTAAGERDTRLVHQIADLAVAAPRRVIVVSIGALTPPGAERLPNDVPDVSHLPLEELGGSIAKSWMRGEYAVDAA